MNLKFLTRLVVAALLIGFVASCIEDNDYEEYIPPTSAEEMATLSEYLDTVTNRGFDIDTTDMGVYYIVDSVGTGEFPMYGDTCVVKYTGMFLDGTTFDSSGDYTFSVILGETSVIEGWTDGLQKFNENSTGYLIIPSEFAYGSTGVYDSYGNIAIPAYTTLVFRIEMVDVKEGY